MNKFICLMVAFTMVSAGFAQESKPSARRVQLVLKGGQTVEGDFVRLISGQALVLRDDSGTEREFALQDIVKQKELGVPTSRQIYAAPDSFPSGSPMPARKSAFHAAPLKNPGTAVALSLLLSSTGHAYAGNWKRGLGFTAGRGALVVLALTAGMAEKTETVFISYPGGRSTVTTTSKEPNGLFYVGVGGAIAVAIWEAVDASKTAQKYNANLETQHGLKLKLVPGERGRPQLRLVYAF